MKLNLPKSWYQDLLNENEIEEPGGLMAISPALLDAALSDIVKSQKIEQISKVCHQANKAFCESLGDFSQVDWAYVPDNIKASAKDGVRFHMENPNVTPEDSHNNWLKFKEADGWVYGEVKDMEKKTHPCYRPYSELPLDQQKKDKLFKAIVTALSE